VSGRPHLPGSRLVAAAVAIGAAALAISAPVSAHHRERRAARHVLLLSADGMHQSDLAWYVRHHPFTGCSGDSHAVKGRIHGYGTPDTD